MVRLGSRAAFCLTVHSNTPDRRESTVLQCACQVWSTAKLLLGNRSRVGRHDGTIFFALQLIQLGRSAEMRRFK